jgi:hypothetical protein
MMMFRFLAGIAAIFFAAQQAEASIYKFEFHKTSGDWPETAGNYLAKGNPFIIIDVPSINNLDIFQYSYGSTASDDDVIGAPIIDTWFGVGLFNVEDASASISTDSSGLLTSIQLSWGYASDYYLDVVFDRIIGGYSSFPPGGREDVYEEALGYWTITQPAPVTLPATAPMLLTGAALLFVRRRKLRA